MIYDQEEETTEEEYYAIAQCLESPLLDNGGLIAEQQANEREEQENKTKDSELDQKDIEQKFFTGIMKLRAGAWRK